MWNIFKHHYRFSFLAELFFFHYTRLLCQNIGLIHSSCRCPNTLHYGIKICKNYAREKKLIANLIIAYYCYFKTLIFIFSLKTSAAAAVCKYIFPYFNQIHSCMWNYFTNFFSVLKMTFQSFINRFRRLIRRILWTA